MDGCAVICQAKREPVFASAPERAPAWLLVEHPGPWPWREWPADLPGEAAQVLDEAEAAGVRVQLIRRVRDRRKDAATVIAVGPAERPWTEQRTVADLRELAGLDVAALAAGRPPGFGALTGERPILVCTHGKRDVCCARFGRPVAVQLDTALPGRVWETTHVGGDRFAANVVTLPDGGYHGGITAIDVPHLAAAVEARRIVLQKWRGRAGLPVPVQAAEYHLRTRCGLTGTDDIQSWQLITEDPSPVVEFTVTGGDRHRVAIQPVQSDDVRLTSCAGPGVYGAPVTFDLLDLQPLVPTAAPLPI